MLRSSDNSLRAWVRSGEPWIWANATAVGLSIAAVGGLLLLIAVRGFAHFWPADVAELRLTNGQFVLGEITASETISRNRYLESGGDPDQIGEQDEVLRYLLKTGNRRVNPPDFRWVFDDAIDEIEYPSDILALERTEWGNAYGRLTEVRLAGIAADGNPLTVLEERLTVTRALREQIDDLESGVLNQINYRLEQLRLERRAADASNPRAAAAVDEEEAELMARFRGVEAQLRDLYVSLAEDEITIAVPAVGEVPINLANVIRIWRPNEMSWLGKLGHYGTSLWLFLSEEPREANTEGGIFPALFGTVMMVLLMSVLVTPFGVIAALYLREYARQGPFVRLIRIAVNNLAGVPSIVFGVFGLGFFVYFLGGNLDRLFFDTALPAPTFGTPGLMWASLTLALLTVPVVIVSTEEGLTRIPRALREGSLALGATKAETLFRVVLPMATPSILTGVILAIARAAGEVAPLMLVGVVKLAPTLPVDGNFPFIHLERKFMHLGFHIYDVGFQSPNVEAARPLVYATALLLVAIIVVLNLTAITMRNRLESRYRGVES